MVKENWITLTDYSNKYKVSVSTLRRRIKCNNAEYLFENGKYWMRDLPLKDHKPLKVIDQDPKKDAAPPHPTSSSIRTLAKTKGTSINPNVEVPSYSSVDQIIEELKKAYALLLEEKEAQILSLRNEISDLNTLVRVLESQSKVKKEGTAPSSVDSWLELEN